MIGTHSVKMNTKNMKEIIQRGTLAKGFIIDEFRYVHF